MEVGVGICANASLAASNIGAKSEAFGSITGGDGATLGAGVMAVASDGATLGAARFTSNDGATTCDSVDDTAGFAREKSGITIGAAGFSIAVTSAGATEGFTSVGTLGPTTASTTD